LEFAKDEERMQCFNRIENSYPEVKVVFPDINNSDFEFSLKKSKIYWGLSQIKGVGEKGANSINESRNKKGDFVDLQDFFNKVEKRIINKRVVLALILSGCFDEMYKIESPEERIKSIEDYYKIRKEKLDMENVSKEFFEYEFKRMLTVNMFDYEEAIKNKRIKDYVDMNDFDMVMENQLSTLAGLVTILKDFLPKTKTEDKDRFGMLVIEQSGIEINIIIWSDLWIDMKTKIKVGDTIAFRGVKKLDKFRNKFALYSDKNQSKLYLLN
jgi:DNA polymerase III alpha subunit